MTPEEKSALYLKNAINLRNQERELPQAAIAIFYDNMLPEPPEGFTSLRWINAIKRYMRDEHNMEWPQNGYHLR